MSRTERQQAQLVRHLKRRGISSDRVLAAMRQVPRQKFVAEPFLDRAFDDTALPAAAGQTISQPFVVALMTQMLDLSGEETVLEIGTGTGYQTAVLATLCRRVVTIERIGELASEARRVLDELGFHNIEYHIGDGTLGWPDSGPYDGILVTAGAPDVPSPLYNQLRPGGRLVIPVGDEESQTLTLIIKGPQGPEVTDAGGCRFVKLIGDAGWETSQGDAG